MIKPIAMKCTQEQFNQIKPILESNCMNIVELENFNSCHYLINNLHGKNRMISNVRDEYKRTHIREVFEEWNQDTFLEYCGIEVKPKLEIKPIAMKCNREQFEAIKPILIQNNLKIEDIDSFRMLQYLTNNICGELRVVSNTGVSVKYDYNRQVFEEWNQDTFLEYCGIKTEQKTNNMGYKLTVPVTDVLKIHAVACEGWKTKIVEYLSRVDAKQNITFTEQEVEAMFRAATEKQTPILKEIFGEKKPVIDYGKLKIGSKVMIKYTEENCGSKLNENNPVQIVYYKTPFFIDSSGIFQKCGIHPSYITFIQNGSMGVFASDNNIDYITEVIEY